MLLAVVVGGTAFGQTTIVSDNYNVTTATTGFALDNGVNYRHQPAHDPPGRHGSR